MSTEKEKAIAEIEKLKNHLPKEKKEELTEILAYWEKIKAEWERKKKEFWGKHDRDDFMNLLKNKWAN